MQSWAQISKLQTPSSNSDRTWKWNPIMNAILRDSQLNLQWIYSLKIELRLVIFYFSSNTKLILSLLHFAGRGGGWGLTSIILTMLWIDLQYMNVFAETKNLEVKTILLKRKEFHFNVTWENFIREIMNRKKEWRKATNPNNSERKQSIVSNERNKVYS